MALVEQAASWVEEKPPLLQEAGTVMVNYLFKPKGLTRTWREHIRPELIRTRRPVQSNAIPERSRGRSHLQLLSRDTALMTNT